MASYHPSLQRPRAPFESPAKVFAKLKSRVQRTMDEAPDLDNKCGAAEVLGGMLCTPKRRPESQDLTQHQRFGNGEVTAVTLSPISSPQKNNNYRPEDELSPFMVMEHVFQQRGIYVPRERAFLKSTSLNATTHKSVQHTDGVCARAESADRMVSCEPGLLEEDPGHPRLISPTSVFSPMKKRLRKRKWDEQELSKVNCMLSDVDYVHCQAKEREISPVFSENDYITSTKDVEACSQLEELRVAPALTGCAVETPPPNLMTPAKMFAYLKERENQRDQCDDAQKVTSSTRTQAISDNRSEATAGPDFAASSIDRLEGPDSEGITPEPGPAPVLLEDPLVLNSPCFIIPKTEPLFKCGKWPQCTSFPSENVVHLRKWFIRKSQKGLFVDGINRENNIPWNSNIITDRVSNTVLKTVSGRVYVLVGKMDLDAPTQFPKCFLKSFANGFPSNWKELYEKYLSKGNLNKGSETQKEKIRQKSKSSMILPVKQQRQKSLKTSESYPSAPGSSAQVSRSGRLIKPPLEYWKGGRVILDAHMNVTIHECYDTSIIQPEITAPVSTKPSVSTKPAKKPAVVMVPMIDVCEQRESIPKSQPLRKVKAPLCRRHPSKANIVEKPLSPKNSSPTERVTRSALNRLAMEKTNEETVPHLSKNSKKKATKQPKDTDGEIWKGSRCSSSSQRSESSVSPPATLSSPPSTYREKAQKKKSENPTDKKSQMNRRCRSSLSSPSSDSSKESGTHIQKSKKELSKVVKTQVLPKQRNKMPPPSNPSQKTSQPNNTQPATRPNRTRKGATSNARISQQDEDEWTMEELKSLHEAVACYPKHIAGYWTKVAKMVGTRSAEECHKQHTSMGTSKTPTQQQRKKKKKDPPKAKDLAVISARVGTLRRKQQVREFLEAMPKEDMDDVFSSAYMQSKRFEVPSMCASDDHDFTMSDLEPLTPRSAGFPEAKTPQCLHITPGMMGSTSRNCDDKYVFHLQKRMKNNQHQFNVQKHAPKSFTPTASVKKTMRRCANTENDTFVVWQMFPEKDEAKADSSEEEDFYFSEND